MGLIFKWDPIKAKSNLKIHGVSFEEASTVFGDPHSTTIPDQSHSMREERFVIIGLSFRLRTLIVVHTEKGNTVRIITAREATRYERKTYEES